jgi:nucleotide-binding universal stress UspA family protein
MFRDILVAVDGSPTSKRALEAAGELAEALNSRLTIISVAPQVPPYAHRAGIDVQALAREAEADTQRLLRESVAALPERLPVTTVLKHGDAGERIVEQIDAGGHELLVMGSRGRGRMAANLFGSVAAHVHYHAHVAVLVIHPEEG